MRSPQRSRRAACTSSSPRRSRWTISSLEIVAAPWRAKASSASDLPAPMPPVTATVIGRGLARLALFRGRRDLVGRGRIDVLACVYYFGLCLVPRRRLGGRVFLERRRLGRQLGIAEHVLGEIEMRRSLRSEEHTSELQ